MSKPDIAKLLVDYMENKGYTVDRQSQQMNIIYIEGMNLNGTLNDDRPNAFNDLRLVLEFVGGKPSIIEAWDATTEPGNWYTKKPMNALGAARIAFGQYKAWKVGFHGNSDPHEALVQCAPVKVHRDFNKDFIRKNDKVFSGVFGINQHWGYDLPLFDVNKASAGCLVGRTRQGHREFMMLVKSDRRYQDDRQHVFRTTIIAGDDLIAFSKGQGKK